MKKDDITQKQYDAKEQVSQELLLLRRYLADTLCGAREFVVACLEGASAPILKQRR